MKTYSMDLRSRVIADRKLGMDSLEVAEKYSVSRSWVNDLSKRYRENGHFEPKRIGGYKQHILKEREGEILQAMKETPDMTLKELKMRLRFKGSLQTVSNMLKRLGFSLKKNPSGFRTRST
jgi:transposase